MTLDPQLVIPRAQNAFIGNVNKYCSDKLFGTETCPMTLAQLTAQALLIAGATNSCGSSTVDQQECFLNNLNNQKC